MGKNSNYVGRRRAAEPPTIVERIRAKVSGRAKPRGRHAVAPPEPPLLSDDTQVISLRVCHDEA